MSATKKLFFILPALFLILSTCAPLQSAIENKFFKKRTKEAETPGELAREGMILFQDKDYKDAMKVFKKIRDLHPL
jgi:outer membrane protein assembly factor BamD (BamD/ComL family)